MIKQGRNFSGSNSFIHLVIAAVALLSLFSSSAISGQNAEITITENSISAAGKPYITYMQFRVVDPEGQIIFDSSTEGTPVTWTLPEGTPDGFYSYEVTLGKEPKKTKKVKDNNRGLGPKIRAMVESGSILVKGGSIIQPGGEEETSFLDNALSIGRYALNTILDFIVTPAAADQVILDDLIVDGSTCVGQDCVNGESFGFDTIRLKENNLRIKFQDTSNSASFPTRDWQITANDSSNGGANKFSIDDIDGGRTPFTIEAGASSHSLYVDDGGRIGLGTSTPVVQLHMKDGNTPTLRLEQDGSSGFAAQTWDVAGNEANFFIRDASNGSNLVFRIEPGTAGNTLYLKANENIGIGTNSPAATVHIKEDDIGETTLLKVEAKNGGASFTDIFTVAQNGDAFVLGNLELGSSRSYKKNIQAVTGQEAMEALAQLDPVHFTYKFNPGVHSVGFIAEDVPDIVATKNRKSLRPMDIVAVLTKVVQEQQKAIEELNTTITELQQRIGIDHTKPAAVTLQ